MCPHCGEVGHVEMTSIKVKTGGFSTGKATAAVLTAGLSLIATGFAKKQRVVSSTCTKCGYSWNPAMPR